MGQVRLTPYNSLIKSSGGLFGLKADIQLGRLRIHSVIAQQETETRRITSGGNMHRKEFEIPIDRYDENQHFFLSHYFYHQYDEALKNLPHVNSAVRINRIEVWVTNSERKVEHTRNLVAFADLAEGSSSDIPFNNRNMLYNELLAEPGLRNIQRVTQLLADRLESGKEYEKLENARLLEASEYRINEKLGYISLERPLLAGEVLAAAFEYSYKGNVYQVGEFSTEQVPGGTGSALFLKLIRGTHSSPALPGWQLMMKNIYSLPSRPVEKDHFRLDILFRHDSTGLWQPYLPEVSLREQTLLQWMHLDRLDRNQSARPDGLFDFIEGYTVQAEKGKIIFPVTEPFGLHLKKCIGDDAIAGKYVFSGLYDSTGVYARQQTDKNKFILKGEYRGTVANTLPLGMIGIVPGTVRVTSGGITLQEQTDYTVDYATGVLTILNENVIRSGNGVEVSVDNQSVFSTRRKTLLGMDLDYTFNKNLSAGATIMRFSERISQNKPTLGEEPVNNTIWGLHFNYYKQDTSLIRRLNNSYLNFRKPLELTVNGEFAQLIPGKTKRSEYGEYTWLDDFESVRGHYGISDPYAWQLAAVPWHDVLPLFPEASLVNDMTYGKNRSLLAWYRIDGIFTRKQSIEMPAHLKNDKEQLSNHYVRAVTYRELYPAKEFSYTEGSELPVLNLAFYPEERGPYNLDAEGMLPTGKLTNPAQRWAGITRKLEWNDFEAANIGTIEFWLLDPFLYDDVNAKGGDLYLNLGELSEDVLKDGKKFFENGLPVDGDLSRTETTVWGRVPAGQAAVYAFDNSSANRKIQDVGLNGLSSGKEKTFPAYRDYLDKVSRKVSPETLRKWDTDPLSPLHDPAGDTFHHFRGSDYDRDEVGILDRYKRYNGTEGNSSEGTDVSAKFTPDTEDINGDNLLNENERYFEYKISIRPSDMQIGQNYITDIRTTTVQLENGKTEEVRWYQFKIPVRQYNRRIGNIPDFHSVRFVRLYLTGWEKEVVLRLASFGLVRSEWRNYEQPVTEQAATGDATIEITTVSLEENSDRTPVNYVLPPGVIRNTDPAQVQQVRHNEQLLSLKIKNLQPEEVCAVYKDVSFDIRRYHRLQLFVHAEALPGNESWLQNGDLSLFLRLGTDHRNNYYEYEIPLVLTPGGNYNTYHQTDQEAVWPLKNFLDLSLSDLLQLKQIRNRLTREQAATVDYRKPYSEPDPQNLSNRMSVCGQPSLGDIRVVMVGIRNQSSQYKEAEVWINELRVTGYEDKGGGQ
ncbi:MAG: cell surface protein SprA [Tannerellaceae bacterium]|nr:cell surface protein SprA [Tannerellaceae bacterium]